jgi:purine nucleoside phosphorylase
MNPAELKEWTREAWEVINDRTDLVHAVGIIPGTGWKEGIEAIFNGIDDIFEEHGRIPYSEIGIPGQGLEVPGHSKALRLGAIEGRAAILIGRVHSNENITDPSLRQAMAILIGALRFRLDGIISTSAVGTLHGKVGTENGRLHSTVRTAILDVIGWAHRGRRQEVVNVGDLAVIDDMKTGHVGSRTPLGAGDFVDFYHNAIHREDDRYFNLAREAVKEAQGRAPRAIERFMPGPQFEGPSDKIEYRAQGEDVIGMSGIQEILVCARPDIDLPIQRVVLATNGPFKVHSHEDNKAIGRTNEEKASAVLKSLVKKWPKLDR